MSDSQVPYKEPTSGWNHRIMRRSADGGSVYSIHEVYYGPNGAMGWTEEPCRPSAESLDGLREYIEMMRTAFSKPVLDLDKMGDESKGSSNEGTSGA